VSGALERCALPLRGRRRILQTIAGLAGFATLGAGVAQDSARPREVTLTARRFAYDPPEIPLKAGERVVIAVRSIDFVHGMNIPDLGKRFDLMPGKVTRFELQPMQPGVIDFVCDNFCGEGHEEMHGRFVVTT
jgi:cytochrome c oxidase subunit 2